MGQKRDTALPKAPCARILMLAGAKRVSQEAMDAFCEVLEAVAEDIGKKAIEHANHAGRKTVHDTDIRLAVRMHQVRPA